MFKVLNLGLKFLSEFADLILVETQILSNFLKVALKLNPHLIMLVQHLMMKFVEVSHCRVSVGELINSIILLFSSPLHSFRERNSGNDFNLRWCQDLG